MPACSCAASHHFLWCGFKRAPGSASLRGGSLLFIKATPLKSASLPPQSKSQIKMKVRCDTNLLESVSLSYSLSVNGKQRVTFVSLETRRTVIEIVRWLIWYYSVNSFMVVTWLLVCWWKELIFIWEDFSQSNFFLIWNKEFNFSPDEPNELYIVQQNMGCEISQTIKSSHWKFSI